MIVHCQACLCCLQPQLSQQCSYVNAALLAADFNIRSQIGDVEGEKARRTNGITVQVETTSGKQHIIVGSVFGIEGRIVQIGDSDEFPAFKPEGNLLFFRNQDKPGAISGILECLAEADVNVSNLGVSRRHSTKEAFGILTLDDKVNDTVLEKIKNLETLETVHLARME